MAAGDTIPGKVRIMRRDASGNKIKVAGPFSQGRVDTAGQSQQGKLYVNVNLSKRRSAPLQAEQVKAQQAVFKSGEQLIVEHISNTDNGDSIDVSADEFNIEILEKDLNRNVINPETLTVADNEITTDPAQVVGDEGAAIFRETVGDRREIRIAGVLEVAATEVA